MSGYEPIGTLPDGQRVGAAIVGRYPQLIWGPLLAQIERERVHGARYVEAIRGAAILRGRVFWKPAAKELGVDIDNPRALDHVARFERAQRRHATPAERTGGSPAGWITRATPGEAPEPPSSLMGADEVRSPAGGSDASSAAATADARPRGDCRSSQRTGRWVACDAPPSPAS